MTTAEDAELARLTDIIEEQKRTIQSLMMGVEEHTGKEGTTAVLAYIGGVEAELAESRAQVARLRHVAGIVVDYITDDEAEKLLRDAL